MADSQRAVKLYRMRGCPHGVRRPTRRHGAASVTATAAAVLALLVTASLCLDSVRARAIGSLSGRLPNRRRTTATEPRVPVPDGATQAADDATTHVDPRPRLVATGGDAGVKSGSDPAPSADALDAMPRNAEPLGTDAPAIDAVDTEPPGSALDAEAPGSAPIAEPPGSVLDAEAVIDEPVADAPPADAPVTEAPATRAPSTDAHAAQAGDADTLHDTHQGDSDARQAEAVEAGWAVSDDEWVSPPGRCRVRRVDNVDEVSSEAFWAEFHDQPFIFRHNPANISAARAEFSKPRLVYRHGNMPVFACNSEGAGPMRGCEVLRLDEWVQALRNNSVGVDDRSDEIHYLFNSNRMVEQRYPQLLAPWPTPTALPRWWPGQSCFNNHLCIGQPGAGLPFHWHMVVHGHEMIYGRKRWLISKGVPSVGVNPKAGVKSWLRHHYPLLLALHGGELPDTFHDCTLGPGDVMYLPAGWYHATLNIDEVVSVTYQCTPIQGHPDAPPSPSLPPLPESLAAEAGLSAGANGGGGWGAAVDGGGRAVAPTDDADALVDKTGGGTMHMHLYRQLAPAIPSAAERSARMRQAAAEYPLEPEFHYHASLALAREARLMHAPDEDKLRAALYYVDSAVALNPYASHYHTHGAELQYALDNHTAALAQLDAAVELDPNNLHACLLRADATALLVQDAANNTAVCAGAVDSSDVPRHCDDTPRQDADMLTPLDVEHAYLTCVARATHLIRRRHRDSRAAARAVRYLKAAVDALHTLRGVSQL